MVYKKLKIIKQIMEKNINKKNVKNCLKLVDGITAAFDFKYKNQMKHFRINVPHKLVKYQK